MIKTLLYRLRGAAFGRNFIEASLEYCWRKGMSPDEALALAQLMLVGGHGRSDDMSVLWKLWKIQHGEPTWDKLFAWACSLPPERVRKSRELCIRIAESDS